MQSFKLSDDPPTKAPRYCPPVYEVPRDPDDPSFVISFPVEDSEGIKSFFAKFGFVIVREAFTKEECESTIDDIWDYIEQRRFTSYKPAGIEPVQRNNPDTWVRKAWPGMANEGIVGTPPTFTKRAILNRQNPTIHRVGSILLGRDDLYINHDRYGLFRPTKNVKGLGPDGLERDFGDHGEWKTDRNLHLDMNPWTFVKSEDRNYSARVLSSLRYVGGDDFIAENNEVGCLAEFQLNIQGLINLADNREEDGGFHIVPGFHHHLEEWVGHTKALSQRFGDNQTFIVMPPSEPFHKIALRLTCRAGSIIFWDQRVCHGSAPNNSSNKRCAQFFKVFPATPMDPARKEARALKIAEKIELAGCRDQVTELGAKMFGLAPY